MDRLEKLNKLKAEQKALSRKASQEADMDKAMELMEQVESYNADIAKLNPTADELLAASLVN